MRRRGCGVHPEKVRAFKGKFLCLCHSLAATPSTVKANVEKGGIGCLQDVPHSSDTSVPYSLLFLIPVTITQTDTKHSLLFLYTHKKSLKARVDTICLILLLYTHTDTFGHGNQMFDIPPHRFSL